MALVSDAYDLGALRLSAGEGRHLDLQVSVEPFELAGEQYTVAPDPVALRLDVARTTGAGFALRLRFGVAFQGPCMRCLEPGHHAFSVDAREISQPGEGEELSSPYVETGVLDLRAWARDALALSLPAKVLCHPDCAGLCPECGARLQDAGPEHYHDPPPDPRWAKLSELRFDDR